MSRPYNERIKSSGKLATMELRKALADGYEYKKPAMDDKYQTKKDHISKKCFRLRKSQLISKTTPSRTEKGIGGWLNYYG